jgi:TDG/mug DNA glycosylase family protein
MPRTGTLPGHILPDLLAPGLRVVFCGSAVGRKSAELGLPYAGPGNKFWPTLFAARFLPEKLIPADYLRLLDFGYGLTDLNKTEYGADSDLNASADDADALREKIERVQPRVLAFTAKRPAQSYLGRRTNYGFHDERIGETRIYVLPSPSGLAVRYWDESWWTALADAVSSPPD